MSYITDAISGTANAASSHGLSGKDWAGLGLFGAAAGLPLAFGGGDSGVNDAIAQLKKRAASASSMATTFSSEGQDLFGPVSKYLKDVIGPDRQALLQATAPQRRRVIDQYATAKNAIAEFSPRGGGQASSMSALQSKEASDLAQTTNEARQEGFQGASQLSTQMAALGINAESLASGDLNSILQAVQAQQKAKSEGWAGVGQAIGTMAAFAFL